MGVGTGGQDNCGHIGQMVGGPHVGHGSHMGQEGVGQSCSTVGVS